MKPNEHMQSPDADPVTIVVEKLLEMSKSDPERFTQIQHDLERAQTGENPRDLDIAVRDLSQEVRTEVLRRLAGPARASYTVHESPVNDPNVN